MDFNTRWKTIITGGGDGNVSTWDHVNKTSLVSFSMESSDPVTALKIHKEGNLLAVAKGDDLSKGLPVGISTSLKLAVLTDDQKKQKIKK